MSKDIIQARKELERQREKIFSIVGQCRRLPDGKEADEFRVALRNARAAGVPESRIMPTYNEQFRRE